ncbi:MAG TPA: aromatic ring-hydroxylating dioxygenase subunit alpha [Ramlibacter sp.]|nr:aromatic ring-hydroxylating dioxygenase subunit alpha [Ramlibacter sp.]
MNFLKNAWYVAAWSEEIKAGEMFHRTLLNEAVLFYRRADGKPVAMLDRCPHRFIPLHMGKLQGDVVECCYHGLRFDCEGRCVHNPHGTGKIPAAAKVRTFPAVDRHQMLWIWMGAEPADESLIPDYSVLDTGGPYETTKGYFTMECDYELLGENLLDLSHVPFLHDGLLGSPEMARGLPVVREVAGGLQVDRWMPNIQVPQVFDLLFRRDGKPVDMWNNMRWNPPAAFMLDTGVHAPGESREQGAWYYGVHILTPENQHSTHYHFASARLPSPALAPEFDQQLAKLRRIAFFDQDKPILEAQQRAIGEADFWSLKPALFEVDAGPARMRRMLEAMVAREAAGTTQSATS